MRSFWKDLWFSAVMGILLPALLLTFAVSVLPGKETVTPEETTGATAAEAGDTDLQSVTVLAQDGQAISMTLRDYLTGVLLAEMPLSFEAEALKAQAIVARTYTMRAAGGASKHESAAVCTDASCCQGYREVAHYLDNGGKEADVERLRELIAATDGLVLTYEGKLIEATYFSCSGGITEDAVAVWGTDVPYLQSVESPGEEHAAHYTDTITFSAAEFSQRLGRTLSGKPETWFGQATYTEGGGVATLLIGGESYTGTQLRKLLSLRSTSFQIEADNDSVTITTRGYGHRVGMSQYGADAMAAAGSSYGQILAHYYQGTQVLQLSD